MTKSRDAFRTISEVADWLETPAHVLRFWESKFTQVKPVKRAGGRRYYRPADMELLSGIKHLLHDEGMTIKGVQKVLREKGVKYVAALSPRSIAEDALEQEVTVAQARVANARGGASMSEDRIVPFQKPDPAPSVRVVDTAGAASGQEDLTEDDLIEALRILSETPEGHSSDAEEDAVQLAEQASRAEAGASEGASDGPSAEPDAGSGAEPPAEAAADASDDPEPSRAEDDSGEAPQGTAHEPAVTEDETLEAAVDIASPASGDVAETTDEAAADEAAGDEAAGDEPAEPARAQVDAYAPSASEDAGNPSVASAPEAPDAAPAPVDAEPVSEDATETTEQDGTADPAPALERLPSFLADAPQRQAAAQPAATEEAAIEEQDPEVAPTPGALSRAFALRSLSPAQKSRIAPLVARLKNLSERRAPPGY